MGASGKKNSSAGGSVINISATLHYTATWYQIHVCSKAPHMTSLNFNNIETLTGSNYKKWKEDVEMVLGLMDLDLALREEKPAAITTESTADHKAKFEKWERTNRMSLMIMRKAMAPSVKGGVPKQDNAKAFLAAVGEKFKESDKAETGTFLTQITSMKFDGEGSVREHILKMVDLAQKLKDLIK